MPSIYLDVCCLNRPFDDQTQVRIHLEAEAVLTTLAKCQVGAWEWASSQVSDLEIDRTPDPERRRRMTRLVSHAHRVIQVGEKERVRAQQFEAWGMSAFDALHLACAECNAVDVFLSTDDKLLNRCRSHAGRLSIRVANPLAWLQEVGT